ncbi:MAG: hypothetical protein WAM54_13220 [Nitrososphaeraceae archaeon]
MTSEMKQQQIDWRRAKVLDLSSQGYTEREIAEELQPIAHPFPFIEIWYT